MPSAAIPLGTIFPAMDNPKKRIVYFHNFSGNWLVLVLQNPAQYKAIAAFYKEADAQAFKRLLKKQSKKQKKTRSINGPGA